MGRGWGGLAAHRWALAGGQSPWACAGWRVSRMSISGAPSTSAGVISRPASERQRATATVTAPCQPSAPRHLQRPGPPPHLQRSPLLPPSSAQSPAPQSGRRCVGGILRARGRGFADTGSVCTSFSEVRAPNLTIMLRTGPEMAHLRRARLQNCSELLQEALADLFHRSACSCTGLTVSVTTLAPVCAKPTLASALLGFSTAHLLPFVQPQSRLFGFKSTASRIEVRDSGLTVTRRDN